MAPFGGPCTLLCEVMCVFLNLWGSGPCFMTFHNYHMARKKDRESMLTFSSAEDAAIAETSRHLKV